MSEQSRPRPARRRFGRGALLAALLVLAIGGGATWWITRDREPENAYRTEAVSRGDLSRTVSASGTLEALVTVDVGSQLSGQVTRVLADFNDQVRRGQLLAVLDPSTYNSRIEQAQASVAASRAGVGQQQAALSQAEANVTLAEASFRRQEQLQGRGFASQAAFDTARAELESARAAVRTAQAQIRSANAEVNQQQAALGANRVDLARTTIVAPINGVIVDRQIEPGQTVAASLSAPILFTIAGDLSRVQANILVDEADIGSVREGQTVRFTVDAFPEETYRGVVTQVRKQPQTEQNVVAYVVLAEAANPGGRLLPGMTANADIILEERRNVLRVPAAALRFQPASARAAAGGGQGAGGPIPGGGGGFGGAGGGGRNRNGAGAGQGGANRLLEQLDLNAAQRTKAQAIVQQAQTEAMAKAGGDPQAQRRARRESLNVAIDRLSPILRPEQRTQLEALRSQFAGGGRGGGQRGTVWVLVDDEPQPVPVRLGATDGSFTEITTNRLNPGDQVITGGGPAAPVSAAGGPGGGRGGGRLPL